MAFILPDITPPPCEECGMGAVHHGVERFSLQLDSVVKFLLKPLEVVAHPFIPYTERAINVMGPGIASLLFKLGLAVKVSEPDSHSCETAQALWNEAKKRDIEMYEVRLFGLPRRHFVASDGKTTYTFEGIPRPTRRQPSISWVDDKAEVKRRFREAGFPVAPGKSVWSEEAAAALFHELEKPVIVKPREGSGGRHTTTKIHTEDELRTAYRTATMIAPDAIVEQELFGPVFRATLVNKNLVAVLRRDPPHVVGDGVSTIQELVDRENQNPLRRGPVFAEINLESNAAKRELARAGLTPESIPANGTAVYFHFKVNWGVGGISYDETEKVHPDNQLLFTQIGEFLGDDIVGIDFIISDISKSWKETPRCGVIECNSLPLIGNHHFPYHGPVRNVAGAIWDMVFPKKQKTLN